MLPVVIGRNFDDTDFSVTSVAVDPSPKWLLRSSDRPAVSWPATDTVGANSTEPLTLSSPPRDAAMADAMASGELMLARRPSAASGCAAPSSVACVGLRASDDFILGGAAAPRGVGPA